jgi:hypothetical protein
MPGLFLQNPLFSIAEIDKSQYLVLVGARRLRQEAHLKGNLV